MAWRKNKNGEFYDTSWQNADHSVKIDNNFEKKSKKRNGSY